MNALVVFRRKTETSQPRLTFLHSHKGPFWSVLKNAEIVRSWCTHVL